jgi:signal transduction histidine kinase
MSGGGLSISVKDDGLGFDTSAVPGSDNGHFGLAGVRERLLRHNGTISLSSSPGHGTTVTLTLKGANQ